MKAQTKALVASVVVIALALSAVSGITYSWFSDTQETEITVTTGKIDLDVTYATPQVTSYNGTAKDIAQITNGEGTPTTTDVGGTVSYTTDSDSAAGYSKLAITFENAAPGDVISFHMTVNLSNSINVIYKQSLVMASDSPFEVTGFANNGNDGETIAAQTSGSAAVQKLDADITITYPQTSGSSTQGSSYTIVLAIQAIQSNVAPAEYVATETIKSASGGTLTVKSSSASPEIKVTIPSTVTDSSGQTVSTSVTAKALTSSDSSDSTISTYVGDGTLLTGVEIKSSETIKPGNSDSDYFQITINISSLTDDQKSSLIVKHSGTAIPKDSSTTTGGEYYTISADGNTITIYANSFSPFMVIAGCVSVDGTPYTSLSEAITNADAEKTIMVLKDIATSENITIDKNLTLDLNGKTIEFTDVGLNEAMTIKATVTLKDSGTNGTIKCSESLNEEDGHGVLIFVCEPGQLTIEGGTYEANYSVLYAGGFVWEIVNGINTGKMVSGGEITINGGTFKAAQPNIETFTVYVTQCNLTINGGTFYGEYQACIYALNSTVKITGGYFSTSGYIIDMALGDEVTITGGTFVGKAVDYNVSLLHFGSGSKATVSGGKFTIEAVNKSAQLFYLGTNSEISVTGGDFTLTSAADASGVLTFINPSSGHDGKVFSGGTFNVNPENYLVDGYTVTSSTESGTTTYSVIETEEA